MMRSPDRARLHRAGALVAVSTLVLTASFVGFVGLTTGAVAGTRSRLPAYVLALAIAFVATLVYFEETGRRYVRSLRPAGCVAVATFLLVGFGGEGVVYVLTAPGEVVGTRLFAYLLSAGLIGSGVGYWGWRNWRALGSGGLPDAF